MLVAERQQYSYYPQYDQQHEKGRQEVPTQTVLPREQAREKTGEQVKPKTKGKIMPMLMLIGMFAFSCLVVGRYAIINQNHQNILKLENALEQEKSRQENLRVELAVCGDLNRIEKVAKEDLGMDYPTKDQVQVVSLFNDSPSEVEKTEHIQHSKKTIIERIIDMIN